MKPKNQLLHHSIVSHNKLCSESSLFVHYNVFLLDIQCKMTLSCHEQIYFQRLHFERYFFNNYDGRSISRHILMKHICPRQDEPIPVLTFYLISVFNWCMAHWWEKYLSERSLVKHMCSWCDRLIILRTLTR